MTMKKLTPNLMVRDIRDSVTFYADALGFEVVALVTETHETETNLSPGRHYVWALIRSGPVEIMLQEEKSLREDISALAQTPIGASATVYLETENLEALHGRIRERVEIVKDLEVSWYGMKELYVRDRDGYILALAEPSKGL
ncbi:MAG: hypothetical protein CSA35_06615 [Dethiosulfovibrio peptidovorans]|nr:MAG: hypothetical protein CSA35_06615 [Dethiosulfovibrio peptidovorans]